MINSKLIPTARSKKRKLFCKYFFLFLVLAIRISLLFIILTPVNPLN